MTDRRQRSTDFPTAASRRRTLVGALVVAFGIVALAVAVAFAATTLSTRTNDNCARIHQLVRTLDTILASGEAQTAKYVQEGLLTPEQGRRADMYRERQRQVLAGADCQV